MKSAPLSSIRLEMLKQLSMAAKLIDFRIPKYCIIPHREIVPLCQAQESEGRTASLEQYLLDSTRSLASDEIFARAQPLDESLFPNLSFAGVYQSYVPRKKTPRAENLVRGFDKVLSGRYSAYSEYYYSRHNIKSNRPVDVMFSTMVDDVMCFGTAYVIEDRCLIEYFDTPISIFLCDPVRIAAEREQGYIGVSGKLIRTVFAVNEIMNVALDIEFLVDRREQVFVSQVRPISPPHIDNWKSVTEQTWDEIRADGPPSNVINTLGTIEGMAVDLRRRKPSIWDFAQAGKKIYIISHRDVAPGTSSLEILQFLNQNNLSNIALVVDHGDARMDDHLQYIMYEDPGIVFLVHSTGVPKEIDGEWWRITSDGFHTTFG